MPLPAVNRRLAQAIVKTVPAPDLSLRGGRRPTWRPEREARGSALGVQSREGSCSSYKLSLKWCAPIASVAALTAQPLAALPPYGCGVPLAGCERLAGWQSLRHAFCGARLSDLSLRGGRRPTWQSREGSCSSYKLSLKWCAPIASVAALTAQPLAALPPYGCGVPLAGCERLAGWQSLRHAFCGARLSDLSLRGRYAPVAISQHNGR